MSEATTKTTKATKSEAKVATEKSKFVPTTLYHLSGTSQCLRRAIKADPSLAEVLDPMLQQIDNMRSERKVTAGTKSKNPEVIKAKIEKLQQQLAAIG